MSGRRGFVWIKGYEDAAGTWHRGCWAELDLDAPRPNPIAPLIMRDVEPYRSVITGEQIGGRAQHREHLKLHGCIEVGNEMPTHRPEPLPSPAHAIQQALQASPETHAEARVASERAAGAL